MRTFLLALIVGIGIVIAIATAAALTLSFSIPTSCTMNQSSELTDINPSKSKSPIGIVAPRYDKSWKLTNEKGFVDWSPVDNVFIVETEVYCADGTFVFSIANGTDVNIISNERFSPDGYRIAYLTQPSHEGPFSRLEVFDIKNKTRESIEFGASFLDSDWGQNNNLLYYSTGQQIIKHDINSGDQSSIVNATSFGSIREIDVSHDGKSLLYTEVINTSPHSPCNSMFPDCVNYQLVVRPLLVEEEQNTSSSNANKGEQVDAFSEPIESKVIYEAGNQIIRHPRWTSDGSAITFSKTPMFVVAGYPCGFIIEVTRDGEKNATLFPGDEFYGKRACYNYNLSFNKDQTLIAYSKISGYTPVSPDDFQPENEGTYLTFTQLCTENHCKTPTKTIPLVTG